MDKENTSSQKPSRGLTAFLAWLWGMFARQVLREKGPEAAAALPTDPTRREALLREFMRARGPVRRPNRAERRRAAKQRREARCLFAPCGSTRVQVLRRDPGDLKVDVTTLTGETRPASVDELRQMAAQHPEELGLYGTKCRARRCGRTTWRAA